MASNSKMDMGAMFHAGVYESWTAKAVPADAGVLTLEKLRKAFALIEERHGRWRGVIEPKKKETP